MNKAKLIVTRVFDSERTPQDAFVRALLFTVREPLIVTAAGLLEVR